MTMTDKENFPMPGSIQPTTLASFTNIMLGIAERLARRKEALDRDWRQKVASCNIGSDLLS